MDEGESAKRSDETEAGEPGADEPDAVELPGADAAELGAMLRRAATTGLPQVSAERHAVARDGIAEEILKILGAGASGAGAPGAEAAELRELRDRAREALRGQGIDPDSGEAA